MTFIYSMCIIKMSVMSEVMIEGARRREREREKERGF